MSLLAAVEGSRIPFSRLATLGLAALAMPSVAPGQAIVWMQGPAAGPSPRFGAAMAFDAARGVNVLFGGDDPTYHQLGDTWTWSGTGTGAGGTWTHPVVAGPSARIGATMAYDSARAVAVLFGGYTGVDNGETWEWNGTGWTQRAVAGPSARDNCGMAYDAARGVTVLFGGYSLTADSAETWEWNGTAWTQRVVAGPPARNSHAMAYDSGRGVTVLFGGQHLNTLFSDTWEWNGTAWTQRAVAGASARYGHAMAYDPARQVSVLFGGYDGAAFSAQTWEWNGTGGGTWSQRVTPGPSARYFHSMAFDAAHGITVLFGGYTGAFNAETWGLACYANCDGTTAAPSLNVADFTCFLQQYALGAGYANCDGSTAPPVLNVADFTCFLQNYATGCH